MDRFIEFAGNHPLLAGGFVLVVLLIIFSEIARRFQGYSEVSAATAVQLINRHGANVIDVSAVVDFNKGHIADARHLPVSKLDATTKEIEKLGDKPILVVCKKWPVGPGRGGQTG